ncbi:neuronal acetylcholine receptor subunit alpha-2-like [Gigantopelta aegis]|uniref:neuronal acetylcholine receptor subunit alpha-2-like n=1 Tax=Gigantopelta aegis TaxID=1735272 RepID=UPI001B88C057|nr:neuronal acetylcholine receptor subunit alpha-2-like [Gigantopelta aegis]
MYLSFKQMSCVLLLLSVSVVDCDTNKTMFLEKLKTRIITQQNIGIREIDILNDDNSFFNITIDFIPVAIIGLSEANQVFSFSSIIVAGWEDKAAAWIPSDFDDIVVVSLRTDLIWTPTISATNSVERLATPMKEEAIIFANGFINTFYADTFQTSCHINTHFFPFDQQTCDVLLFPNGPYYFFALHADITESEFFFSSNEWQLVNVTMENRSYTQTLMMRDVVIHTVAIRFKLKRYSTFYVISILAPIGVLSVMNACVFLLPAETGEKISFLVSIFVSYAMFLNFIFTVMPKSDSLSRLTLYLMLIVSQSALSIAVTVYLLNVYHTSGNSTASREGFKKKIRPLDLEVAAVDGGKQVAAAADGEMSDEKTSIKSQDRFMFFVFLSAALMSLLVFVDV